MGLAGLLILITAFAMLLPRLLPLDSVKRDIESRVSGLVGGQITYADVRLAYAPWPQLVFRNSVLEIPGKMSGAIDSLVVVPRLFPLLTGNIEIAGLSATGPHLRIELSPEGPETPSRTLSLRDSARAFAAAISGISDAVKEKLVIRLTGGRIDLAPAGQPVLSCRDIDAELRFSPNRVRMELAGGSEDDETIAFSLDFDPARFSGKSRLELKRFLPEKVHSLLIPHKDLHFGESRMDLKLALIAENPEKLSGTLSGTLALLTLSRGEETHPFQNGSFQAAFSIEKDRTEIFVSELRSAHPALNLTGGFLSDESASTHRWEIAATDLDLSDAGKTARFLSRDAPLAQTLGTVLKDGRVRNITVKDEASSLSDLKKVKNLSIHGFLEKGTVYIPAPDLTLTEATGWVDVDNGILEGKDLRARLGKAKGHGTYRMDLGGEKTSFFLDASVEAEINELPPLLQRLVGNKVFTQEIRGVADASGSAEGRLIIDHTGEKTAVTVAVSRFDLTGRYSRIPYPISVSEGAFHYDADGVRIEKLKGRIGTSAFTGLNARIGTSPPFQLDISSGPIGTDMAQIHPWLMQYDALIPHLKPFKSAAGLLSANALWLKGPALHPRDWQFSLTGEVKDLRVSPPVFPSPITVRSGSFTADTETLAFERTTLEAMDTTLQVEGRHDGYLKAGKTLEMTLTGALGKKGAAWVREKAQIPPGLAWQSPILLAPIRLNVNPQGDISVSGAIDRPNGPSMELTLSRTPQCLTIEQLSFRDDDSDATLSVQSGNDIIELGFTGKLHEKTLNAFFMGTPFLTGHIEGDFRSRFLRSKPYLAAAKGHLYLGQLDFSKFDCPLTIHQASVAGNGTGVQISSARLTWRGSSFLVDGAVNRFQEGLKLDLSTAVEKIDWPHLSNLLADKKGAPGENTQPVWRKFPLYGNVKVHADQFIYSEKLTFRPFEGLVTLAEDQVTVSISQAKLCGLSLTGVIRHSTDHFQLEAKPVARDEDLAAGLACVWGSSKIIDGRFELDGQISGAGTRKAPLIDALSGEFTFSAAQGRIHRFGFFAKIFALLNVAGMLQGEVPDLDREGFPYKTARATATLENGKLKIKEGEIDSNAMRIFFSGEEDLSSKTHDLTIVVAPLSTVDMLVRNIPLVRNILDKGVVIYPITATGTWENPQLNLLAPTAVGEQIWGIVLRTLKLPLNILKPVISGEKKAEPDPQRVPDEKPD